MSRVNVFVEAGNDNRQTSVGGRAGSNSGWARVNTDNATQYDCGVVVRAEVLGERPAKLRKTCNCRYKFTDRDEKTCPKCGRLRQGVDTRKSSFQVELPAQTDDNCEIVAHGHNLKCLAEMGMILCVVKGAIEQASDKPQVVEQGKLTIKKAVEILGVLEEHTQKEMPNITLPGGVTLSHALACVEVCRRMAEGRRSKN